MSRTCLCGFHKDNSCQNVETSTIRPSLQSDCICNDNPQRLSTHKCQLRTCSWNPPDLMQEGFEMDRRTGELIIPQCRCPGNVCYFRHHDWHVAETTSPVIDTEPPSEPPEYAISNPYYSPEKCSLGTCCWHLCGTMSHGLPRYPPPMPQLAKLSMNDQFIHHDSMFATSSGGNVTSNFLVHPDWLSEKRNPPKLYPLKRRPWPWEQPRHRINMQIPRTYEMPDECPTERHTPLLLPYQPPKTDLQLIKEKWGLHY